MVLLIPVIQLKAHVFQKNKLSQNLLDALSYSCIDYILAKLLEANASS